MTVSTFIQNLRNQLGKNYVYGANGEILTQAILNNLADQYPNMFTQSYYNKALNFIGTQCFDCSSLISFCSGGPRLSAKDVINRCTNRRSYTNADEVIVGAILYRSGETTNHVAVCSSNNRCIQALGINYGVIESSISGSSWQSWGLWPEIDYGNVPQWGQEGLDLIDKYVINLPPEFRNLNAPLENMTVGDLLQLLVSIRAIYRPRRWEVL